MTTTPTTNYGFSKITPGTEKDVWGPIQSTTLDGIDTQIKNRANEIALKAPIASPTFTGKVTTAASAAGGAGMNHPHGAAPSAPVNGDFWSTSVAFFGRINGTTYQFTTSADLTAGLATKANTSHTHAQADVTNLVTDLAAKAPLASPALTGAPTAPTAAPGTNTTQLASTAFVTAAVAAASAASAWSLKTSNYVLALGDVGAVIGMNMAGANTWTVPLNATVAFPLNTEIHGSQYGAGQTTITPATVGVTLRASGGKLKSNAQYSGWTIKKIGTDEWMVWGDLTT